MRRCTFPATLIFAVLASRAFAADTQPAPATQPLTASQVVREFAQNIEAEMSAGDISGFRKAFDIPTLTTRAFGDLDASPNLRRQFGVGVNSGLDQLVTALADNMKSGGGYAFLRLHIVKGELRAMFRMTGKTGLNYHDMVLKVGPGDTVRVVDMYIATTGEELSDSYHRVLLPLVAEVDKGALARLTEGESEYVKNIGGARDMGLKVLNKDYSGVHAIYEGLPVSLQSEQIVMLYDLQSLVHIDLKLYAQAMDRYEKAFPDSPSLSLLRIDSTMLAKDWTGMLATIDKLDKQVGGDIFLNVFRVTALQSLGRGDEALAAGEECLKVYPHCTEAYVALLQALAMQKNWVGTKDMMERMLAYSGKFLPTMTLDPVFSEFIKTQEFAEFESDHPKLKFR